MENVSTSINGRYITISGEGDRWQSADSDGFGNVLIYRVMKKLNFGERFIQVLQTEHSIMLRVIDPSANGNCLSIADVIEMIPVEKLAQWLVLEYNVKEDKFNYYYSPERI